MPPLHHDSGVPPYLARLHLRMVTCAPFPSRRCLWCHLYAHGIASIFLPLSPAWFVPPSFLHLLWWCGKDLVHVPCARVARATMERDASSVFGRRAPSSSPSDRFVPPQDACDAPRFVEGASTSLAEQLRVRRDEAEAEQQQRVQALQQGAVRPLDDDEAAFLATCADARRRARLDALRQEQHELATYRTVRRRTATHRGAHDETCTSTRHRRRVVVQHRVQVRPRLAFVPPTSLVAYPSSDDDDDDDDVDEGHPRSPSPPPHVEDVEEDV